MRIDAGDFYLLGNRSSYCLASGLDAPLADGSALGGMLGPDRIVRIGEAGPLSIGSGGRFSFGDEAGDLLLGDLPPLMHIRAESANARALRAVLDLLAFETEQLRPGNAAASSGLATVALVNILRVYLAEGAQSSGWLSGLADPKIGRALRLLHSDITRSWKVDELALSVGMSRTSFAERFKARVGMAPLEYLIGWRMRVAKDALRSGQDTLVNVAAAVGYASETSFSLAFKARFGLSPGLWRKTVHGVDA